MTDPTPNLPLLRKTLDWVRLEHEKNERGESSEWNQDVWFYTEYPNIHRRNAFDRELARVYSVETDRVDMNLLEEITRGCGTACCVAGKIVLDEYGSLGAILIDRGFNPDGTVLDSAGPVGVSQNAVELLGITNSEASQLFNSENTYDDVVAAAERIANRAGERL